MKSTTYIKTPMNKPLIRRKWAAKQTKDINQLSSFRILCFLYSRHEVEILYITLVIILTLISLNKIGVI